MFFKRFLATISVVLLSLTGTQAAKITRSTNPECRVEVVGEISKGDSVVFESFADYLIVHNGESTSPSIVCLDSPGGSVLEGMAMAKFIIKNGVSTRILADKQCASICAIMFMMGNYRGDEVAGLSRRMHYTSRLGFHRPYLKINDARNYTSNDLESIYDLGIETIYEIFTVANQREPWGTAQMIEPELVQRMIATPSDEMFYVSTIEEATRWNIDIDGIQKNIKLGANHLQYACENALAYPVDLTSQLNGNDSVLGQAIFYFNPLNSYSVKKIATLPSAQINERTKIESNRAGYSNIGCEVQIFDQSVAICGYDESTGVRIGNCNDESGMRHYSKSIMLHPKTQLSTFALSDVSSDARRITRCHIYDASLKLTDREACLQSVVMLVEKDVVIVRHFFTWPSGSRTVVDIEAAPYGQTSSAIRIIAAKGKKSTVKNYSNCIANQTNNNFFCIPE